MTQPKLTAEKAEKLLADWEQKLQNAQTNMLDMRALPAYVEITSKEFSGQTAAEVEPAMEALNALWSNFNLLGANVKVARELYDHMPAFGGGDRLERINNLLNGASIHLPAIPIPLEKRGLLTPSETTEAITPQRLLEILLKAFDVAVKVVTRVNQAKTGIVAKVDPVEQRFNALDTRLKALGAGADLPTLEQARSKLAGIYAVFDTDPLGADEMLGSDIPTLLTVAERKLKTMEKEAAEHLAKEAKVKARLVNAMTEAQSTKNRLLRLKEITDEVRANVLAHISEPLELPRNPDLLTKIVEQLSKLAENLDKGLYEAVETGLESWKKLCIQFNSTEQAALDNYRALLAESQSTPKALVEK